MAYSLISHVPLVGNMVKMAKKGELSAKVGAAISQIDKLPPPNTPEERKKCSSTRQALQKLQFQYLDEAGQAGGVITDYYLSVLPGPDSLITDASIKIGQAFELNSQEVSEL